MEYLDSGELRRLFQVAYGHNKIHHLAMLTQLHHALRVSELLEIKGTDIHNGLLTVQRKKGSKKTRQPIVKHSDPLFDGSPLLELARIKGNEKLFAWSRQYMDFLYKKYGELAGIHPDKRHSHTMKHSQAIAIWKETKSLGEIQSYLGHVSSGSTLIYLYEADSKKAQNTVANIKW